MSQYCQISVGQDKQISPIHVLRDEYIDKHGGLLAMRANQEYYQ